MLAMSSPSIELTTQAIIAQHPTGKLTMKSTSVSSTSTSTATSMPTSTSILWQASSCDFDYSDFAQINFSNGFSCAEQCSVTLGCTHFTWNGNTNVCYMKYARFLSTDSFNLSVSDNGICGIVIPCSGTQCTDTSSYSKGALYFSTQNFGTSSGYYSKGISLPNYYISAIYVHSGSLIDGIQLEFQNSVTNDTFTDSYYGGSGGNVEKFAVPNDEFITSIYICFGVFVYQLRFKTNKGTKSPYYGGYGGTCAKISFEKPGLLDISVKYEDYLNRIQFFSSTPIETESLNSPALVFSLSANAALYSLIKLSNGNIASGSDDATVKIWDPITGSLLKTFNGHTRAVNTLIELPNENLASGSNDNTIIIWDMKNGSLLFQLIGHTNAVRALMTLPNGNLASGSYDETENVKIWNPSTGDLLYTLDEHTDAINSLITLPNGNLASGSYDYTIKIWNSNDGSLLKTLNGHTRAVKVLIKLPNGNLASGSNDATVKIWDPITGSLLNTLNGHTRAVNSLITLPNGNLASGSNDNTIIIWNSKNATLLFQLFGHTKYITSLTTLPNGLLVTGSFDYTLKIWNSHDGTLLDTLTGHLNKVQKLVTLSNSNIVSGSFDTYLKVWNISYVESLILTVNSSLFGYSTGTLFNLTKSPLNYVQKLEGTFNSDGLNSIQFQFSNSINNTLTSTYGVSNGTNFLFQVPDGDIISTIYLCIGSTHVYSIQFITYQGKRSSIFGGSLLSTTYTPKCHVIFLSNGLTGIEGYSSNNLNGLIFESSASIQVTPIIDIITTTTIYSTGKF
jgi:WD40 repeat protein